MPTLFRLLFVIGVLVAMAYGAMFAIVTLVKPQQHEIVAAVALPHEVNEVRTGRSAGRSAAEKLDEEARILAPREHHRHRNTR